MSRTEYLSQLKERLIQEEIPNADQMIEYYAEMIDDRMEDGMTEEEAVSSMESIESIVSQAKIDRPITSLMTARVKESHDNAKKKGKGGLWMVLAILGFPVWFPLLTAFSVVVLALYIVLWAVVVALFAVEFSFGIAAIACIVGGFGLLLGLIPFATALAAWGCAMVLIGLFILLWKPVCKLAEGLIALIRISFRKIKGVFIR